MSLKHPQKFHTTNSAGQKCFQVKKEVQHAVLAEAVDKRAPPASGDDFGLLLHFVALRGNKNKYFQLFSKVVTLISLLTAFKETCSPSSIHIYLEQGYIPQECNASKAGSKSL